MTKSGKKLNIGAKQALRLCQMSEADRLRFLAEGLPIILASATSFWNAAERLAEQPREAAVLTGFAEEEAAKILMLIDIVRCPPSLRGERMPPLLRSLYAHLARLLYAEAQSWRPTDVKELRRYIDESRKTHYLDGALSEYIFPNSAIAERERQLYADIEAYEDGVPLWSAPRYEAHPFGLPKPYSLQIAEALSAVGAFSANALRIVSDVWGSLAFVEEETHSDALRLTNAMLEALDAAGLVPEAATNEAARPLVDWQMPMYALDFSPLAVSLEELDRARDAALWNELGR